jgi:hypothetical protein
MSSMKCPQCGLINWADAEACKRCKLSLNADATPEPAHESGAWADAPDFFPQPDQSAEAHQDAPDEFFPPPPPQQWGSPYGQGYSSSSPFDSKSLEIDFEVAPFVDVSTTLRDTYALSRSQFKLILSIVLTAIAPHVLLIIGASGLAGPSRLPAPAFGFGAPPASLPTGAGASEAGMVGAIGVILLIALVYQFFRLAVVPPALIYGIVTSLRTGVRPSLFECYRWGFKRCFTTGFALIASFAMIVVGIICLIVPGIILGIALSLVLPIAAIEGCGAIDSVRRSLDLTKGRRGAIARSTFAWGMAVVGASLVLSLGLGLVSGVLRSEVLGEVGGLIIGEVLGTTTVVLSLVIYLGIAHYREPAPANYFWDAAPAGGGWEQQPAFGAPPPHAAQYQPHAAQYQMHGAQYQYQQAPPKKSNTSLTIIVACCAIALVGCVAIVMAIAIPNLYASRMAANEALALKNMRTIVSAQATYSSSVGNGRFGTLEDLVKANLISPELASGTLSGYKYKIEVDDDSFEATATPVSYSSTGKRSFYACEDGVIRGGDKKGLKAGPLDPPVQMPTIRGGPAFPDDPNSPVIDPGSSDRSGSWPEEY